MPRTRTRRIVARGLASLAITAAVARTSAEDSRVAGGPLVSPLLASARGRPAWPAAVLHARRAAPPLGGAAWTGADPWAGRKLADPMLPVERRAAEALFLKHRAPGARSRRGPHLVVPMPHENLAWRREFRRLLASRDLTDRYDEIILRRAVPLGLDARLVKSIIAAESQFNPRARSPRGARGLMQVLPATAGEMGVRAGDLDDPDKGVEAGTRYLALLFRAAWLRFRLSSVRYEDAPLWLVQRVVAAYHAGPRSLARDRWKPSTRSYVRKVLLFYQSEVPDVRRLPGPARPDLPDFSAREGLLF